MASDNPLEKPLNDTWPVVLLLAASLLGGIAAAVWAIYLFANAGEAAGLPVLGISAVFLLTFGGIINRRQSAAKKAANTQSTPGYDQ